MYVFDSDILIEFLRGRLPLGFELLKRTDCRLVRIPAIVKLELLVGAYKSSNPEKAEVAVERLLANYEVVPFDGQCARIGARIRADLERRGRKIGSNDYQVAATTLSFDAVLVTNNVREFKRIPDLRLMSLAEVDL